MDTEDDGPFWANSSLGPPVKRPGQTSVAPLFAGLTSAEDIAARQVRADREYTDRAHRSSLAGLTLRTALEDLREVVVGIPSDLYGASGDLALWDVLTRNDRLRGLGLLALCIGVLVVAIK